MTLCSTRASSPADSTNRGPGSWIGELTTARSVEALRSKLAARYPALAGGGPRSLVILGAADEGRRLAGLCARWGIDVVAIVDDNPVRQGASLHGRTVQSSSILREHDAEIPVIVCSHRLLGAVLALSAAGRQVVPFAALQLVDPARFPPHMFHEHVLEDLFENRARYAELLGELADDRSREVLDAVIGFRLTFDPRLLEPVLDKELYAPDCVLPFVDDEVYVDGGAYDGDTVRLFIQRVGGAFSRVWAFEPDPGTYRRLQANFASEPRVVAVAKGLYSETTELRFDDDASRASLISDTGQIRVPVTSIDAEVGGQRVTYIKMNIEGAELQALDGARETIQRHAPRLAISAYHRASDLWRVPEKVKQLRGDYRLFLRQHDGGIIETVLYAVADRGRS